MNFQFQCWILALLSANVYAATNVAVVTLPPCCRILPANITFTDRSIFQLESTWTSDVGREIKLGVLHGKPQVFAMFFTSCQYACPLIVGDMKRIQAALPKNLGAQVGFTLVSFDSERDTPQALRTYRALRELPAANWTLVGGKPDDVRELAALLGVNYRKDANGQFAHSNLITILNAEGEVVYQQVGLNQPTEEIVKKLKQMF